MSSRFRRSETPYTKHHLKFGKNQADNPAAVFNRFILDFGADFFLYFIGVWYYIAIFNDFQDLAKQLKAEDI